MNDDMDMENNFDGEEETELKPEEKLKLEAEFKALLEKVSPQIDEQLKIAQKAIDKAEKLAEKHGIPFYAGVSPLGQNYTPDSFAEKFGYLDKEFISDETGVYPVGEDERAGWEHSAVCW